MKKVKNPKCCFCNKTCENEFGNNPYPVSDKIGDRCCNECNNKIVIPERLKRLKRR